MRITSGKVIAGKIVIEGESLPEGTTVTVLSSDDADEFELTPADEAALLEAIGQADAGQTQGAGEVLQELRIRG